MNNFLMPLVQMLAISEGAGGLFDFNATLPLMALQFVLLTVVLTFVFYKPVSTVLEERETLINTNLSSASEKLLKADELCKQHEEQLKEAKLEDLLIVRTRARFNRNIVSLILMSPGKFPFFNGISATGKIFCPGVSFRGN